MTIGISVWTASSMSLRRVSGPRFGATPVSTQALRFWYMIARVPSIGSTMIRHRASSSRVPRGSTTRPPSMPSAISTSAARGATSREKKSTSVSSLTRSIGVDGVALPPRRRSRTSRRATRARRHPRRRGAPPPGARGWAPGARTRSSRLQAPAPGSGRLAQCVEAARPEPGARAWSRSDARHRRLL